MSVRSSWVLAVNDFICVNVASFASHMSIAFLQVNSGSFNNLLQVLSHLIPQTIQSQITVGHPLSNEILAFFLRLRSVAYVLVDNLICVY